MKTLQDIKKLESELRKERSLTWAKIIGLEEKKISIINDEFISISAESIDDLKAIFTTLEPFKNGFKVDHKTAVYLTAQYLISIENNYYNRELKFEFEMINELKFWVKIPFSKLPTEFNEKFVTRTSRGLYDTETVYVNIESHLKKFEEIRIESYRFNAINLNWYGGNQTLIDEYEIKNIIDFIKK